MPEQFLFDFAELDGGRLSVYLRTHEDREPWIVVRDEQRRPLLDFSAAALFRIQIAGEQVRQCVGDGPEVATLSGSRAYQAAELALEKLADSRKGVFQVIWVPHGSAPF